MADENKRVLFVESSDGDYQIDAGSGAVITTPEAISDRPEIVRFDLTEWSAFHRKEILENDIISILDLGYYYRKDGNELYEQAEMGFRVEQHILQTAEDGIDLRDFDGFEVEPCALVGRDADGTEILERTDRDSPDIFCWTVYGHYEAKNGKGGVEALHDYPTVDHADASSVLFEAERMRLVSAATNAAPLPADIPLKKINSK